MSKPSSASSSTPVSRAQKRRGDPKPSLSSAPPAPDATRAASRKAEAGESAKSTKAPSLLRARVVPDRGEGRDVTKKRPISSAEQYGTIPYFRRRHDALKSERSTWLPHWYEIADHMAPRRSRRSYFDRNRGVKKNEKIINSTALIALRTLASGMHSGLTSPARPWYRLTTPDPQLAEIPAVRYWLHEVEERMRLVHARSNIYNILPQAYADLGAFGTTALWIDEDPVEVIRGYVFPVGSYSLGVGANQKVDSLYREVSMPLSGVVDVFGYEHCSPKIQDAYEKGHLDQWVLLCQACEPNRMHNPASALSKAWANAWFEQDAESGATDFLRMSGYDTFPMLAPRWAVTGEDIYGYSPGMDALGDVRALQQLERRKLATADKIVNPPFVAPAALRNQRVSLMAGDVSYLDSATPQGARFEPALTMPYQAMTVEEASIATHEYRVKEAFFATLWMLISSDDRATPATAEEIRAKQDEKMLMLGPVLERLHDEMLDPLIDRTFDIMLSRKLVPPIPRELVEAAARGDDQLRVEYISVLAQAQKLVGTAAIDRQVAFVANLAGIRPDAVDVLNTDKLARVYQQMLGTDPEILFTEEEVAQKRAARAQQEQAAAQAQIAAEQAKAANSGAGAVKQLATAPLNDPNGPTALSGLLGALGPAAVAGAGNPDGGIG